MGLANGMFNALTGNPAELNARSFAGNILRRFPNGSAPMFALTSMIGRSRAKATTHGYFAKLMAFLVITQATTNIAGDASFTWPSTAGVVKGMTFFNRRSREIVRISAVSSATVVAVTRGFGRIPAAAVNAGDIWVNIGTAFEEGSDRPESRRITTSYVPNFTQIFRNAWAMTDTARASYAEAGISNIAENKGDCAMFHSVDIEATIIWGQAKMDTTGSTPIHATQGVIDALEQYAPENTNVAAGTTNFDQLVALSEPAFKYSTNLGNSKERVGFGDAQALRVLNSIGRQSGQIQMMTSETRFGMKYTSFQFYKGSIDLIEHPLMNELAAPGSLLIMDMSALKLAYMDGRDTVPESYGVVNGQNRDPIGKDATGGSLTTELAVELINPYSCALIEGLTAGAA
ncbi:putative major capsid protein [Polaromonas phage Tiera]|nr:putative major capsid protein [Polaromonas phage Tiera]